MTMVSVTLSFSLSILVGLASAAPPIIQDLSFNSWTVQNQNLTINVATTVPGGIYTDLRNAGVLAEDIFYRFNDVEYRWVAKDNWTYFSTFDVDSKILKKNNLLLEFEGLDTVTEIVLNSNLLGKTNNMFVRYTFDVKSILKEKGNKLEVQFMSAIWAAQEATATIPYSIPPKCNPQEYHGECHINYLRKMQASFAWDWGPAFPSVGIWKDVSLQAYDVAFARYLTTETRPDSKVWKVCATLFLDVKEYVTGTLSATLFLTDTDLITYDRQVSISPQNNSTSLVFSVSKDKVQLWWPNGHGNQPLYRLTVAFKSRTEVTQKTVKIGFRTIKLVQTDAVPNEPKKGLTFYFRVNGVSIFAKGSNFIPAHILPELGAERTRLRRILTSARDANMNMLRVWGGGLYESDTFYEMCDELGILIWQDMMFACAMYPSTEEFLANVAIEVTQAVLRLQHHACIAIWAGNNENEAALAQNWYGTQSNFSLYKADYVKLYVGTIRPIILRLDKTRSYVVSSPSNGLESEYHGYVDKNPYSALYGDLHAYDYVSNLWNSAYIPKTRFSSEYGIMSLPCIESLANVSLPEDLYLNSEFMSSRQHHVTGYIQMIAEIKHNVYLPENYDLETFIYLSQINQAMSMKTETESYRRGRGELNSVGEGLTMGALYWQLNDVWQGPSWSSMEFSGKWKMLHYFAADFFSPVLVSPNVDITKELRVYIISDLKPHTSLDLILQVYVYNWQSFEPVNKNKYSFTVNGAGVFEVASWNLDDQLKSIDGCLPESLPQKNCFYYFSLLTSNSSTSLGPDNFYFPEPLKSINGPANANIKVEDIRALKDSKELVITLSTDAIAPFVWLDTSAVFGHFSHNGFLLVTKQTQLSFKSEDPIDVDVFKKSLKIKSLIFQSL